MKKFCFYCLKQEIFDCVFFCVSNFNTSKKPKNRWGGYSIPQILKMIENTVQDLFKRLNRKNEKERKLILIGHDWGAFFAYLYQQNNPQFVDR